MKSSASARESGASRPCKPISSATSGNQESGRQDKSQVLQVKKEVVRLRRTQSGRLLPFTIFLPARPLGDSFISIEEIKGFILPCLK